jgi:SAM-dependent methyltransferase
MPSIPARIAWAVELLAVEPDDRILEFGCGPGVAAGLVADRLATGRIVAIDRSATAIERARARNTDQIAAGRLELRHTDLAGFNGEPDQFDKAFAVNVNVFWTSGAEPEGAVLACVLRPGGELRLVYDDRRGPEVAPGIEAKLDGHGFACEILSHPTGSLVCIAGRLGG